MDIAPRRAREKKSAKRRFGFALHAARLVKWRTRTGDPLHERGEDAAMRLSIALGSMLVIGACQSLVVPVPDQLRPWTTELRAAQPEDAFAAIYTHRDTQLIFVGARHSVRTDSATFRLIDDAYSLLHVDLVIVEGSAYSRGPNHDGLLKWAKQQHAVNGRLEGGETVVAIRGATARGADVWGGEPDDADIRSRMLGRGFSLEDLVGFYTLRSVPQWILERKITGPDDPGVERLIESDLARNRERLEAPSSVLPDYEAWTRWYTGTNDKVFGAAFEPEETGPLADGRYRSNKIAEGISRARAEFLLDVVARHLNAGESVMVVFGTSHLMIHRPALDHMLGAPCYAGNDLKAALAHCRDSRPSRVRATSGTAPGPLPPPA
jgi:hypothetical protein